MPNEKDLQYFYNIYTKFKFRFKNWMYIIFLIRYDFKRKRHNLDRLLSKESRLEAGFHDIHTHKLNRSRQTRTREKKKHRRSFRSHSYHPRSKDLIEPRCLPKQMIFISLFPFFSQERAFINYLHEPGNRIVDPIDHNLTLY